MINVVFRKLAIRNFLSVGEETVSVDFKTGLNIITGRNFDKPDRTNGVGKSTIADALYFALFGSTLRDLSKDDIYNNLTSGKCAVGLDFDIIQGQQKDEYKILRTINPSKCVLSKNGEDITRSGIPQTTELIAELIHATPEMFQNSVIMTLNNTIPFMSQKKADKRKFIEGILNLGVFGEMLLLARAEYSEVKRNFDVESAKHTELERTIALLKNQQEMFEQQKKTKLADIDKRIAGYESEIEIARQKLVPVDEKSLETPQANIKTLKAKLDEIDAIVEQWQKESYAWEFEIKSLHSKIAELDSKKGTCKFCAKSIDDLLATANETAKKSHLDTITELTAKRDARKNELQAQKAHKEKIKSAISAQEQVITDIRMRIKENENILSKISQIERWTKELHAERIRVEHSTSNQTTDLDNTITRSKESAEKVNAHKARMAVIDAAKYIVSEEGVKSILVKKILNILNSKLAFYLKRMEANCVITFNEYFEETIVNEKGKTCSYHNFSGAERKAIDLACLFTFMDIRRLQGDVTINVSMFDELLDSSFDEKGVDLVLDILRERVDKYQEAVYIISHRRESIKHVTGDIIYIEKRDGVSTRKDFNNFRD